MLRISFQSHFLAFLCKIENRSFFVFLLFPWTRRIHLIYEIFRFVYAQVHKEGAKRRLGPLLPGRRGGLRQLDLGLHSKK